MFEEFTNDSISVSDVKSRQVEHLGLPVTRFRYSHSSMPGRSTAHAPLAAVPRSGLPRIGPAVHDPPAPGGPACCIIYENSQRSCCAKSPCRGANYPIIRQIPLYALSGFSGAATPRREVGVLVADTVATGR